MMNESHLRIFAALMLAVAPAVPVACQPAPLTIEQAVQEALQNYPSVRVSTERAASAAAAVNLARTVYLPRMDFLGQANRATRNNVFGMLLPQSTIAPISGPVLGTSGATSVWGSAVGMLVSWEPFDFGLRKAAVNAAEAARSRTETAVERTRFEVSTLAADSFLTILAAEQTTQAAEAGVARAQTFLTVVEALVRAELRPGADASRAQAELALAETQLIQARQAVQVAKASLGQLTGSRPAEISVVPGSLLGPSAEIPAAEVSPNHPALLEQRAAIGEVEARRRALDRSYYPRFLLQGTSYARGSGARTDGSTLGGVSGLGPDIPNWAVGMTVTFPFFDLAAIRAKRQIETHLERSETARHEQIFEDLNGQLQRALAALEGARAIAQKTPVQLAAAQRTLEQATARYRAGLAGIVDVAEAQRLLTQTEIDDSLARLNIWRAQLAVASAQGNLAPFLKLAK